MLIFVMSLMLLPDTGATGTFDPGYTKPVPPKKATATHGAEAESQMAGQPGDLP